MGRSYKTKTKAKTQTRSTMSVIIIIIVSIILIATGYANPENNENKIQNNIIFANAGLENIQLEDIPEYKGNPYVVINNNNPFFEDRETQADGFPIRG